MLEKSSLSYLNTHTMRVTLVSTKTVKQFTELKTFIVVVLTNFLKLQHNKHFNTTKNSTTG